MAFAQFGHEVVPEFRPCCQEPFGAGLPVRGGGAVAYAPGADVRQSRDKLDGGLGEAVGGAAAGARVVAGEQARIDEPCEPVGEDVGGDAFLRTCLELSEVPSVPEDHVPQYEECPAVPEDLHGGVDRACGARPRVTLGLRFDLHVVLSTLPLAFYQHPCLRSGPLAKRKRSRGGRCHVPQ